MRERLQRSAAPLRPEDAAVAGRLTSHELRKHLTARLRAWQAEGVPVETWPRWKVARVYTATKIAELQWAAHWSVDYSPPEFRRLG